MEKTIGELIDAYRSIQLRRMELSAEDKALIADQKTLQDKIFEAFEQETWDTITSFFSGPAFLVKTCNIKLILPPPFWKIQNKNMVETIN